MAGSLPRLLLVDDDEANLRTFQRVFRGQYAMSLATSASAALEAVGQGQAPFDVVIADFAMPGMNGVELLQRLEQEHPALARVMLTAHAELPEVVRLARSGAAVAVLMKPWDRAEVEQAVASALRRAEMQRAVAQMKASLSR